jgi:hypothetical protein
MANNSNFHIDVRKYFALKVDFKTYLKDKIYDMIRKHSYLGQSDPALLKLKDPGLVHFQTRNQE